MPEQKAEESIIRLHKDMSQEDMHRAEIAAKSGVPVLAVYYKDGNLTFLGFGALTVMLENGCDVEKYITGMIAQARKLLVPTN